MKHIERTAELCPDGIAVQPCRSCGSTAAVVRIFPDAPPEVRRLCCNGDPWWRSAAGRGFFAQHGVDVIAAAEARRHG